jgi:rhodanese-related sulfurtransferase
MTAERPFRGALVIVFSGIALGIAFNLSHPDPIPWKPKPKSTVKLETLDANTGVPSDVPPGNPSETETVVSDPPPAEAVIPADPSTESSLTRATHAPTAGEAAGSEPSSLVSSRAETAPQSDPYADVPESEFPIEIGLAKAKELYDRGGLLVLDAREREEYVGGHIKGAICAPVDDKVGDLEWLERTARDPRPILVYCGGGDCEVSVNLGFEIARSGHRKVLIFIDGYVSWLEAGHPVGTGEAS